MDWFWIVPPWLRLESDYNKLVAEIELFNQKKDITNTEILNLLNQEKLINEKIIEKKIEFDNLNEQSEKIDRRDKLMV